VKTPRELVAEMHRLKRIIAGSHDAPGQYMGWHPEVLRANCEKQLTVIQRQLVSRRRDGVMGKGTIRGLLGTARLAVSMDAVNRIQVELQNGIVAFSDDARERRRCKVALLFMQFYRSRGPVTDALVDELYWLLGSSFDDLDGEVEA